MSFRHWLAALLFLAATAVPVQAQEASAVPDDILWARGLAERFGFDDLAEEVLDRIVADDGAEAGLRSEAALEKARLVAAAAARESDAAAARDGYARAAAAAGDARSLARAGDGLQSSRALLVEAEILRLRARAAGPAGTAEDLARAEELLGRIPAPAAGGPAVAPEEAGIRVRAWILRMDVQIARADAAPDPATGQKVLQGARKSLETFVLAHEGGDEGSLLAALQAEVLLGRVHAALGDAEAARSVLRGVLEQIDWSRKPPRPVQSVAESAGEALVAGERRAGRNAEALEAFEELEARMSRHGLEPGPAGRRARLDAARARIASGEPGSAAALAADVARASGTDATGREASALLAEILAAGAEPLRLPPWAPVLAAQSVFEAGAEARERARGWLEALAAAPDALDAEDAGRRARTEALALLGAIHARAGRWLEAGRAFGGAARRHAPGDADEGVRRLAASWEQCLEQALATGGGADAARELDLCRAWLDSRPGFQRSAADRLWREARKVESDADERLSAGRPAESAARFAAAAGAFDRAAAEPGADAARARLRAARMYVRAARAFAEAKDAVASTARFREALERYRVLARDRDGARGGAAVEAALGQAEVLDELARGETDAEAARGLRREVREALAAIETSASDRKDLLVFGLELRFAAALALGDTAAARADLRALRDAAPEDVRTAQASLRLGRALKDGALAALDKALGGVRPTDERFAGVRTRPEWAEAAAPWLEVCGLHRSWLALAGSDRLSDWEYTLWLFARGGAWDEAVGLGRAALPRFAGKEGVAAADLHRLRARVLVAFVARARDLAAAGDAAAAADLVVEAGPVAEALAAAPGGIRDPDAARAAALVAGGWLDRRTPGQVRFHPGRGLWEPALQHWEEREKALRGAGDEASVREWWEAKWYILHAHLRLRRESGLDPGEVRTALANLKAAKPDLGGADWIPCFAWLEQQMN